LKASKGIVKHSVETIYTILMRTKAILELVKNNKALIVYFSLIEVIVEIEMRRIIEI
jgi:hypothetical protein